MKRRNKTRKLNSSLSFEALEKRELLTSISYDPVHDTLTISGTDGHDTVQVDHVSRDDPRIKVSYRVNGTEMNSVFADPISKIVFIGDSGNDTFQNNTHIACSAYGGHGDDILIGGGNQDQLHGDEGDDLLNGGDGNDYLAGNNGRDTLAGGKGDDNLWGGDHDDRLFGEAGNDLLEGQWGNDQLEGGDGNDKLYGWTGDDRLVGGSGNDFLSGYDGLDRLFGGEGNDSLWGGKDNDLLFGDAGQDVLEGQEGNDVLDGGDGHDKLYGWTGDDWLYGGRGADYLSGYEGNDYLFGGDDRDWIDGGSGNDEAKGGKGFDRFRNTTVKAESPHVLRDLNFEKGSFVEAPLGSPQNDGWSCGPNSAARLLHTYGKPHSYDTLKFRAEGTWFLSKLGLGLTGSRLRDVIKSFGQDVSVKAETTLESLRAELDKGKPAIALLQVGSKTYRGSDAAKIGAAIGLGTGGVVGGVLGGVVGGLSSITVPKLHWVLVNGYSKQGESYVFHYVDTDGIQKSMGQADFSRSWNWNPSGFNPAVRAFLKGAGLKARTIIS